MASGIVSLANGAAHLASPVSWIMDPQGNLQRAKAVGGTVANLDAIALAAQVDPQAAWTLAKPVVSAATADYRNYWNQGDYAKLGGRVIFDAGTMLAGGLGGAAKLGEGADTASALERAGSLEEVVPNGTSAVVADAEFIGPTIGRSGFRTMDDFAEALGSRYQGFVDDAHTAALRLEERGLLRGNPNTRVGDYVDRISARDLKAWLRSEGIQEGPQGIVQMNRWLRDPSGSGLYVRPDVRIPSAGRIYDATVGFKPFNSTQIVRFGQYSNGDMITIVRPSSIGSYSIVP